MRKALFVLILSFMLIGCSSISKTEASVSVSATATIEVDPDIAYFRVSAESIMASTEEARVEMNRIVNAALDILMSQYGITEDCIKTEYLSFSPYYEWVNGVRIDRGYRASQSLTITLKDIDKTGLIMDSLSTLDGISLSSISFGRTDEDDLRNEVRKSAVENARIKAEAYATGAGLKVKEAVYISDGTSMSQNAYPAMMAYKTETAVTSSGSTSYYEGKVSVSESVSVLYTLER